MILGRVILITLKIPGVLLMSSPDFDGWERQLFDARVVSQKHRRMDQPASNLAMHWTVRRMPLDAQHTSLAPARTIPSEAGRDPSVTSAPIPPRVSYCDPARRPLRE
jgi:hypothetical protein